MAKIVNVLDKIINFMAFVSGGLVLILMFLTTYHVGARYLFHKPPPWTIEVSEYLLATYAFLGAAWVLKKGGHVKVDLVYRFLDPKKQRILSIISNFIAAISCLVIMVFGSRITGQYLLNDIQTAKVLLFPAFILIIFIPLGFLFLSAQFIMEAIKSFINLNKGNYDITGDIEE